MAEMFGGGSPDALAALRTLVTTSGRSLRSVMRGVTDAEAAWRPPGTANPIGITCLHALHTLDGNLSRAIPGRATVFARGGWAAVFGLDASPVLAQHVVLAGGVAALDGYHRAVVDEVGPFLDGIALADLARVVDTWRGPVTLADFLTLFIAFHTVQHIGEISVVKGLQGKQGFLF